MSIQTMFGKSVDFGLIPPNVLRLNNHLPTPASAFQAAAVLRNPQRHQHRPQKLGIRTRRDDDDRDGRTLWTLWVAFIPLSRAVELLLSDAEAISSIGQRMHEPVLYRRLELVAILARHERRAIVALRIKGSARERRRRRVAAP